MELHPPLEAVHGHGLGRVLDLRFLVEQLEDALRPGDGTLHIGPHDRDLADRLIEALHQVDVGDDQAEGYGLAAQRAAVEQKDAAGQCGYGQAQEAEGLQGWAERGGVAHGGDVGVAVGRVHLPEGLRRGTLPHEGLHLAYSGNVLLEIGVDVADFPAGLAELASGQAGQPVRQQVHDRDQGHGNQPVDVVDDQHLDEDPDHCDHRQQHRDHHEVDALLQRVQVVGEPTHDIAGFVAVEVAERERMDPPEQRNPDPAHHTVADRRHHVEGQGARGGRGNVDGGRDKHQTGQAREQRGYAPALGVGSFKPAVGARGVAHGPRTAEQRRIHIAINGLPQQNGRVDLGAGHH